jgi:hypothetical protein
MSGTIRALRDLRLDDNQRLIRLLDRRTAISALPALSDAVRAAPRETPLGQTAICLDSSVFLRLANHAKSADIVDYLSAEHKAPLILPGQAIQEFWNNQLQVVGTVASKMRAKFAELKREVEGLDPNFGDFAVDMTTIIDKFSNEHGHIYDEATVRKTIGLLDVLQAKAIVPFVPRLEFSEIARQRKRTKTPPGFKDDGDGDFFIWADLLRGLQEARRKKAIFEHVALVTEDKKPDWSRALMPHPILSAELRALVAAHFSIWRLDKLADEVGQVA